MEIQTGWVTSCYAAVPVGETGGVQNLFRRFPTDFALSYDHEQGRYIRCRPASPVGMQAAENDALLVPGDVAAPEFYGVGQRVFREAHSPIAGGEMLRVLIRRA